MIVHSRTSEDPILLQFDVKAKDIFDLRVPDALDEVHRKAGDPFADWQDAAARGREPTSWRARDWIEGVGEKGLIDPSRKAPGLWHLVLFTWNVGSNVARRREDC